MFSTNDCVPAGTFVQLIAGEVPSPGAAPAAAWLNRTGISPPSGKPCTVSTIAGAGGAAPPAGCCAAAGSASNALRAIAFAKVLIRCSSLYRRCCTDDANLRLLSFACLLVTIRPTHGRENNVSTAAAIAGRKFSRQLARMVQAPDPRVSRRESDPVRDRRIYRGLGARARVHLHARNGSAVLSAPTRRPPGVRSRRDRHDVSGDGLPGDGQRFRGDPAADLHGCRHLFLEGPAALHLH